MTGDTYTDVHALQQLEENNLYPPRLSIEIVRSKLAREHLTANVIVKGVDPQVKFQIFTQCPG